jgi:hypothetical protein
MKNLLLTLTTLALFLVGFNACKKQVTTPDTVTYELTLKAIISNNGGSTVFDEIKYTDGTQMAKTLTNVKTDFQVSFEIEPNFPIQFSTKATLLSSGTPRVLPFPPRTVYQVDKITNGKNTKRETVCIDELSLSGSTDGIVFKSDASFTKIFAETSCK